MIVTDIYNNTEFLTDINKIRRVQRINQEHSISFMVNETPGNKEAFVLANEESIIDFLGKKYRIKVMDQESIGETSVKSIKAHHVVFDLIDHYVHETTSGTKSIGDLLYIALKDTGFTYQVIDVFETKEVTNFGDDNALSLLQYVLANYRAEFEMESSNHIVIRARLGNYTDFQFRYKHNLKTVSKSIDTTGLATFIKGFGKKNEDGTFIAVAEYTSPNSALYGIREAKPVFDERFTDPVALKEHIKGELQDEPKISFTVNFVDLRNAGYPYAVPGLGDYIYVIYEPMGIDITARIVGIEEELDTDGNFINTVVTLSNFNSNASDYLAGFGRTQKSIDNLVDGGSGQIKYDNLDDAVKRATEAIQSAQTDLQFINGIMARDKLDPNKLVYFNAAGIGISIDGGVTFKQALTATGLVASAGVVGAFEARNITIGAASTFETGYSPSEIKTDAQTYVDGSFKDGLITETEAQAIEKYINGLNVEKNNIDSRYNSIYNNADLVDAAIETSLSAAKTTFDTEHTDLIAAINNAIADGKTTAAEKTAVDAAFTAYDTALAALTTELEKGINAIAAKKAAGAKDYADGLINSDWDKASIINSDSKFLWDASGFTAIDPANVNNRVKFTSGGIGISTDGGVTYQTAITASGVIAKSLVATDDFSQGMQIEGGQFYVDDGVYRRALFGMDSTLPQLYDGAYGAFEGYGKIYTDEIDFYIPAKTYTPGEWIELTVPIKNYMDVAIQRVQSIQIGTESKEFYAYERLERLNELGNPMENGGDLYSIVIRMSPHYEHTAVAHYMKVFITITGWR